MKIIPKVILAGSFFVGGWAFAANEVVVKEVDVVVVAEVSAVEQVKNELNDLKQLIYSVNATLQKLKSTGSLDMVQDLRTEIALLELKKESARRRGIVLEARATDYYDNWLDQIEGIENKEMRKKAEKRYSKVLGEYNKFVELVQKGRKEFVPYVSDVQDIIVYLDADPSEKALKSLSNSIWKLDSRTQSLLKQIDGIIKQLGVARAAIPEK